MLESHVQCHKSRKINQELNSQSFSSPDEEAGEEHDDHARLDRADEHGQGSGPEELYADRLENHGAVGSAANSIPAIDHDWAEHAEILPVVDSMQWKGETNTETPGGGERADSTGSGNDGALV